MPAHTVTDAAAIVGSSPSQIRNWCGQFSAHLSPNANPGPGQPRWLSNADVSVLQRVKELRSAGTPYADIPALLPTADELPAPYIDARVEPTAVATAQESLDGAIDDKMVLYHVESRFKAVEAELLRLQQAQAAQAQQRVTGITAFGIGLIVGMVAILVIVGLFALAGFLH